MFSIPEELLEQFERDNVIPLVGRGINHGVLPRAVELARQLCKRCDYPTNEPVTLSRVAGYYELTTHDRHSLIDFLRDRLDKPELEPTQSHKLIAQLRPRCLVTICYDRLLERALKEEGVPFTPVVRNEEVAYSDERRTLLVYLWGVIDRPDSLIITEDDHRRFLDNRENLSHILRGELSRRTWLFLGYDPEDERFRNYYDGATRGLDRHRRRSYIVGTMSSEYARAWWAERAQIFETDIEIFLSELSKQLAARRQPAKPILAKEASVAQSSRPLPRRPYKLLDFYEAEDAPIFFGREAEVQTLSSLIYAHRLVLLYSASGAGKTSLLLAGVAPLLEAAEPGYETVYLRMMDSPVDAIRRTVERRLDETDLPKDGSLVNLLDAATKASDRPLVIILDQFEEFFMRFSDRSRKAFITELGTLYDARDVPVKIVLSLREDWLASLNEIKERIPEIFYIDMRLLPLDAEQARIAITAPADKLRVSYDQAVVNRMLQDLMDRNAADETAVVNPPQLQLVSDAVYEHARSSGRQRITLTDYESVGGAQGILERYVELALREHRGAERALAKEVLIALVSAHESKARRDVHSLATELGVTEQEVGPVLHRLTGQRLVRRLDEGHIYELAHDVLAATIATWFDEEERQTKQVRELLRRELGDWRQDANALLSHGKFRRINELRDSLRLTEEESAFLLRAAILYDEDVAYWLRQVEAPDTQIEILLEMLNNDSIQARLASAKFLAGYRQERAAMALAHAALEDAEPAVRDRSAVSLGLIGDQTGIHYLTDILADKNDPRRSQALQILARVQDVEPGQSMGLAGVARFQLILALARIRVRRDWPAIRLVTVTGAIGGSLSLTFGLFLPIARDYSQTFGSLNLLDMAIFVPFLAVLGLLAGAMLALGISGAESLGRKNAGMARVVGGVLLGGLGYAIAMSPLTVPDAMGFGDALLRILGGGLFGALIGLGITAPALFTSRRIAALAGGTLGGTFGFLAWGALGWERLQLQFIPAPMLLVSGALAGFIMALSITIAESRRIPKEDEEKKEILSELAYSGSM